MWWSRVGWAVNPFTAPKDKKENILKMLRVFLTFVAALGILTFDTTEVLLSKTEIRNKRHCQKKEIYQTLVVLTQRR